MRTTSIKPKGQRTFKSIKFKFNHTPCGTRIKTKRPFWIKPVGYNWWFDLSEGQWKQGYNGKGGMTTSYYSMTNDGFNNAYSLKAVKRLIYKWNVPKGTKFKASLPFVGYDFYITK